MRAATFALVCCVIIGSAGLPGSPVFAEEFCPDVRLDSPGGSMEHVPLVDQSQLGTCYAHAAVQLLDAWRFSHGDKNFTRLTSPVYSAIKTAMDEKEKSIVGGSACDVANDAIKNGSCDADYITKSYSSKIPEDFVSQLIEHREKYADLLSERKGKLKSELTYKGPDRGDIEARFREIANKIYYFEETKIEEEIASDAAKDIRACVQSQSAPKVPAISNELIEKLLKEEDPVVFLDKLLQLKCPVQEKISYAAGVCKNEKISGLLGPISYSSRIDLRLSQPHANPVKISFCYRVLEKGKGYRGVTRFFNGEKEAGDCGHHSALVIGRRFNKKSGKCQLLVRNSFGKFCGYSSDWECEKEKGNIWVDEDVLTANIYGISYIQ